MCGVAKIQTDDPHRLNSVEFNLKIECSIPRHAVELMTFSHEVQDFTLDQYIIQAGFNEYGPFFEPVINFPLKVYPLY